MAKSKAGSTESSRVIQLFALRITRLEKKVGYLYTMLTRTGGQPWDPMIGADENPFAHPEEDAGSFAKKTAPRQMDLF